VIGQNEYNAWQFLLLHCNCLSPGLLSPTYETYTEAHISSRQRYSSSNSITALCRLPGVGMRRTLEDKHEEAIIT
jgi:hypothetical protein